MAKPSKVVKLSSATDAIVNALRYCFQPIQRPRTFDSSVDAGRASAIINGGKNG